ncbi:chorismate-binding protein [Gillisia sp. Hel_I_29]|uniref:chorismate-binding protein n=1 Tax=Gillisia sp. Hel_I_29 TaxID=1249975 RepID=UPI00054D0BA4|nr:chorismate-binding protein [Gillisia sp. Hel_I_29]
MIDLTNFYLRIQEQLDLDLPFVAYRKASNTPNQENLRGFFQKDDQTHLIHDFEESGFVFAPFDNEQDSFLIPSDESEFLEADFQVDDDNMSDNSISIEIESEAGKQNHLDLVQQALDAIKNGDLKKVVLSRKESVKLEAPNALLLFRKMLSKYPTAFVYLWYHPKVGIWLGATPETLLQIKRNRLKTMALAGTQKLENTTDVEWGLKEIEEQEFVTNSIIENIGDLDLDKNDILKSGPYTVQAGKLLHLRTDISVKIDDKVKLEHLIQAIHPTPAICGLPKKEAKDFILKNEKYNREFYTGFLGELNIKEKVQRSSNRRNRENQAYLSVVKQTSLFVNLRCLKLDEDEAILYIGGGITKDSDPEQEWIETMNKAQTMKAVLVK